MPATAASSLEWYAIDNLEHKCTTGPDHNPGDTIKNAQAAHQRYTTNDITNPESGRIVETTIELPDMGRANDVLPGGVERCQAALDQIVGSQKNDVDKYK